MRYRPFPLPRQLPFRNSPFIGTGHRHQSLRAKIYARKPVLIESYRDTGMPVTYEKITRFVRQKPATFMHIVRNHPGANSTVDGFQSTDERCEMGDRNRVGRGKNREPQSTAIVASDLVADPDQINNGGLCDRQQTFTRL